MTSTFQGESLEASGAVRILLAQVDGAKGTVFRVRDPDGFRLTISSTHAA